MRAFRCCEADDCERVDYEANGCEADSTHSLDDNRAIFRNMERIMS